MFRAAYIEHTNPINENCVEIPYTDELLTVTGWKFAKNVNKDDILVCDDGNLQITDVIKTESGYKFIVK